MFQKHRLIAVCLLIIVILMPARDCKFQLQRIANSWMKGIFNLRLGNQQQKEDSLLIQTNQDNNQSIAYLGQEYYIGTYESLNENPMFDFMNSKSGTIETVLFKNPFGTSMYDIDTFQMVLFDPIYHDQKAVKVQIQLEKMVNKNEWNSSNANATVTKFWKQRVQSQENISNLSYKIVLVNSQTRDPAQIVIQLDFKGLNFQFSATVNYDNAKLSTIGYCLYSSLVVLIQVSCAYFLLRKIDTTAPNIINKLSLTTVAACNIQDFYLTMVHIEYIMTSRSSTYLFYILPSISYIVLFVVFDMKLLFLVWRSHYMRQIDNPRDLRKKLTTFYIKFYVGLFLYLTLTYFFSFDVWMIVLQNLLMVPQIIHNVRTGIKPGFQPLYVLGYLGARFLLPLYERACPSNHFLLTPILGLVIALLIVYILQILILFLQDKAGPRFLIPKIFQPDYYNYNFKIKSSDQNKDMECNICLQNFFLDPSNANSVNINSSEIEQSILKQKVVMRTPCNHLFHKQCLLNWTDVKLECPTCRTVLPPP